jgi:hypothetical protein
MQALLAISQPSFGVQNSGERSALPMHKPAASATLFGWDRCQRLVNLGDGGKLGELRIQQSLDFL